MSIIGRESYPKPDYIRNNWQSLNGQWGVVLLENETENISKYVNTNFLNNSITVPFVYQCEASGAYSDEHFPIIWYSKIFNLSDSFTNSMVRLCFGAVDYHCDVWLNGEYLGCHTGGYTPFSFYINKVKLAGRENILTLRVIDDFNCSYPRGKQYWKTYNEMCWYKPSSGIWQSVWLESVNDYRIESCHITPDIDNDSAELRYSISHGESALHAVKHNDYSNFQLVVTFTRFNLQRNRTSFSMDPAYSADTESSSFISTVTTSVSDSEGRIIVEVRPSDHIKDTHWWNISSPTLIGVNIKLTSSNELIDEVDTYFGMRKIEISGNRILLNYQALEQKLVLDQGYWPETHLTPPDSEALKKDIEACIKLGFNGARKHQKIEDPHYYYWADTLGFLVWGELPSAYDFSNEAMKASKNEMREFIIRDYNHPSIITWVPTNESWGIRKVYQDQKQQAYSASLYYDIKSYDQSRLVIINDGWEQPDITDIYTIHDYTPVKEMLNKRYFRSNGHDLLLDSAQSHRCLTANGLPADKPIIISEYGGIAYEDSTSQSWGYFGKVRTDEEFIERFRNITHTFLDLSYISGICYTQLTDVYQERNGLMTMNREYKIQPEIINALLDRKPIKDTKPKAVPENQNEEV